MRGRSRSWAVAVAVALGLAGCGGDGDGGGGGGAGGERPGQILGRVELSAGVPASRCRVALFSGKGGQCDANGYYHIIGLAPAKYELTVNGVPEVPLGQRRVPVALSSGLAVNLPPTTMAFPGSVSGRIDGTEGLTEAIVGIPAYGLVVAPSSQRAYFLTGVPPGLHDIVLLTAAGSIVREQVRVEPARTTPRIDFEVGNLTAGVGQITGYAQRSDRAAGDQAGIAIKLLDALDGSELGSATSAADGGFALRPPRVGVFLARAVADPRHTAQSSLVILGGRDVALPAPLVIEMDDGGDFDGDGDPDASDPDDDGDGIADDNDAFPRDFRENLDSDRDGVGDSADLAKDGGRVPDRQTPTTDSDTDGRVDWDDNCPMVANATQENRDADVVGDACDNCPLDANDDQADRDMNGVGDACPLRRSCDSMDCGRMDDGQGGSIVCRDCPQGFVCGQSTPNRCGRPNCTAGVTMCPSSFQCGSVDDGCGGRIPCGTCGQGSFCNASQACQACSNAVQCPATGGCGAISYACREQPSSVVTLSCGMCTSPSICGGGGVANTCGTPTASFTAVGPNTPQDVLVGQRLAPVTVLLTSGGTPVAGAVLSCTIPVGGAELNSCTARTAADGRTTFTFFAPRTAGQHRFEIRAPAPGGGTVTVTANVTAPSATVQPGYVTSLVNPSLLPGSLLELRGGMTAPAALVHPEDPTWLVVHPRTGTLYFVDYGTNVIVEVTREGVARIVAGVPAVSGTESVNRPALMAHFAGPAGLVLDPRPGVDRLYISDFTAKNVRYLDLNDNIVKPFAGFGNGAFPYGIDGPAFDASFDNITGGVVAPNGDVYLSDFSNGRGVYKVAVSGNGTITKVLDGTGGGGPRESFASGALALDADGNLFVMNQATSGLAAIERYGIDGTRTRIAGGGTGVATEGAFATDVRLPVSPAVYGTSLGLAFDPAGNLFFALPDGIYSVDRLGVLHVESAGSGTTGDYGPVAQARWSGIMGLQFDGNDLYVNERGNQRIRMVGAAAHPAGTEQLMPVASSNAQTARLGERLPIPLTVQVLRNGVARAGVPVSFAADPGNPEVAVLTPSARTNAQGLIDSAARVGLAPSTSLKVQASVRDIHGQHISGSPAQFTMTAVNPAPGTLFTAVNAEGARIAGDVVSGPATTARIGDPLSLAVAADGTLYFSDRGSHTVVRLTSAGMLEKIAGTANVAGYGGDGALATSALLDEPDGLALDETSQLLYVAERQNDVVRAIQLAGARNIELVIGRGTATGFPYGDTQLGTAATLAEPVGLALSPSHLYVMDRGRQQVRRMDRATQRMDTVAIPTCAAPLGWAGCPNNEHCHIAWRPSAGGRLLLSGTLCSGGASFGGILSWDPGSGTVTQVAGAPATAALDIVAGMAVDSSDRVLFYELSPYRLMRIEPGGGLTPVVGDGTAGYLGEYVASPGGRLNQYARMAFGPGGRLWIADGKNFAIRQIFGPIP